MVYFLVKPNPEYTDAPRLSNLHRNLNMNHFYQDESFNIPFRNVVYLKPNASNDAVDYLYQSVPLFSSKAMQLIEMFETNTITKQIVLFDMESKWDHLYNLPFFPRFTADVLQTSQFHLIRSDANFESNIQLKLPHDLPIFYVFDKNYCLLFMRLDLVECLLRNGRRGLLLREARAFIEE